MDISVKDAASRLRISEARVRQLVAAGDLAGRHLGRAWLIDSDDVARLQGQRRRSGRPAGPKRAWAILEMLEGRRAPWLAPSERSQVRSYLARLDEPEADEWRGILRGRSELRPVRAHPAAVDRLIDADGVLLAGPAEAARRDFDLVVAGDVRVECYVPLGDWEHLARSLALQPGHDGNVVIRHPVGIWPFDQVAVVSDAVIAADLLDSAEPRAVRAGQLRLNELLAAMSR